MTIPGSRDATTVPFIHTRKLSLRSWRSPPFRLRDTGVPAGRAVHGNHPGQGKTDHDVGGQDKYLHHASRTAVNAFIPKHYPVSLSLRMTAAQAAAITAEADSVITFLHVPGKEQERQSRQYSDGARQDEEYAPGTLSVRRIRRTVPSFITLFRAGPFLPGAPVGHVTALRPSAPVFHSGCLPTRGTSGISCSRRAGVQVFRLRPQCHDRCSYWNPCSCTIRSQSWRRFSDSSSTFSLLPASRCHRGLASTFARLVRTLAGRAVSRLHLLFSFGNEGTREEQRGSNYLLGLLTGEIRLP